MSLHEEFDRPVQNYDRYSKDGLAAIALYRLSECGVAQGSGDDMLADLEGDAFRLNSWVDEDDSLFGNALAISKPDETGNSFMNAFLYKVNRDERLILPEYPKSIEVPRPITNISDLKSQEVQDWTSDLALDLDRDELEVALHMLTKAAMVFYSSRLPAFDKYVYFALCDSESEELKNRYPGRQEIVMPPESTPRHILEWREFIDLAHERMDEEFGSSQDDTPQELFLQHEIDTKHYALNIYRREGKLVSMQILCYEQGAWQGQFIELQHDEDEDDFTVGEVSPVWNRDELLKVTDEGMPMDEEVYDCYLKEAGRHLGQSNNFALSNVICLAKARRKRLAA